LRLKAFALSSEDPIFSVRLGVLCGEYLCLRLHKLPTA